MALVFPLLLAIALAEPLLLDFQSRETWPQPRLQRRAAAEARVYNAQSSLMYLVDVTVGTPPQALKLQLDTGSSDVWIPCVAAPPCRAKRCIEGSFNPQRSKSFSVLDTNSFRIKYVDGTHIGGDYISDSFGIAGLSISNMTMGLATAANEQDSSAQFEGIVGLGFEHGEAAYAQKGVTYPNLISKLKSQGIISSRSYSLWLNDKCKLPLIMIILTPQQTAAAPSSSGGSTRSATTNRSSRCRSSPTRARGRSCRLRSRSTALPSRTPTAR
jgi:hypothetical protein